MDLKTTISDSLRELGEHFDLGALFIRLSRWIFVILAFYILTRCILSLIRGKNTSEVWAYMQIRTHEILDNGVASFKSQLSIPIDHWENVIGRGKRCDLRVEDHTLSRNHGILMRDTDGDWTYRDLGSKNGTYLGEEEDVQRGEFVKISKEGEMGPPIKLEYGDTLRAGLTDFTLMPISVEERNNNISMRKSDTHIMSAGPTLGALTLFQVLTIGQLWATVGTEYLGYIVGTIGGLSLIMWLYTGLLKAMGRAGFEIETIAFFLSTLNLAVVASSQPDKMWKQFIAIAIGILLMFVMCLFLRDLERAKSLRKLFLVITVVLLIGNLALGTVGFGAKNWIQIGGLSIQPSELVKITFIWIGAATLDELFQKKNLWIFMGFSLFCFACLGLMGDFGTASIFFVTFLIISFLRSGDFSKLFLIVGVAAVGGFMILRFKPYVAARFASWGHVWEPDIVNAAGFQQSRAMSAAASGGLVGVGAGNGWLEKIPAADTDMVFGLLIEEWGLIIALLAVASIVTLALFAVRSIMAGRSTYYTIAACGAMSLFIFQTMLNVLGSMDILPFTGVTFPFVSNGGTSMISSWGLLAFVKGADTREHASIAVKGVKKE